MRIVKNLLCLFLFLSLFHGYGFSYPYKTLLQKIHGKVNVDVPTEENNNVLRLHFDNPSTDIYLDQAVTNNYDELSTVDNIKEVRNLHPVAVLIYISIRQGDGIDFDNIDNNIISLSSQVEIVVDIWRLTKLIELSDQTALQQVEKAFLNYLHAKLTSEETDLDKLRHLVNGRDSTKQAWGELFHLIEQHTKMVEEKKIETAARKLLYEIYLRQVDFENALVKKVEKEKDVNNKIIYKRCSSKDEETLKIWRKACEINSNKTDNDITSLHLSIHKTSQNDVACHPSCNNDVECAECLTCCASCCCCFFFWPCNLAQRFIQCCCSPIEQLHACDIGSNNTQLIIQSRKQATNNLK
jgi:hypothetical protein